jgi:RHS repeat-associated protein
MIKNYIFSIITFLFYTSFFGQTNEEIQLEYNTTGYSSQINAARGQAISNQIFSQASALDTIASIKSEMNVSESGALTYMIPFEILKGLNNFQPNLGLAYNSQTGNGQAGWGWNIVGLSSITTGGKSKQIDGLSTGPQFDGTDPFYLDGQRLIANSSTDFVTEKFSKLKVTRDLSPSPLYDFIIQYPDGKIGKYKLLVSGQYYISTLIDALGNEVHYSYSVNNNVPSINFISYGGTSLMTDNFKITFNYINRTVPTKSYRNGNIFINTKVLKEIVVSTTYLTANAGLYRKYILYFDNIQTNTSERLIKVEIQNEIGEKLKPLQFGYNNALGSTLNENTSRNLGLPTESIGLGSIAIGDFYGIGKPTPIYEAKQNDGSFRLLSSTAGIIDSYSGSRNLFTGRGLFNNKISENDLFISYEIEHLGIISFGEFFNKSTTDKLFFRIKNLAVDESKNVSIIIGGNYISKITGVTTKKRIVLPSDFNNDGLIDILIFDEDPWNTGERKVYFAELGKSDAGVLSPIEINCDSNTNNLFKKDVYPMEFDGDGIPELMFVNKQNATYSIFKLNLLTNSLNPVANQQNIALLNFSEKTPLIFGDYNGDGLTDFITPTEIYSIEGSTSAEVLQRIEIGQQFWWQYLATGSGFDSVIKNYTSQKLAYIAPSQRNVISYSSDWDKFWSGMPDSYDYTEYASSSIIPMDFNNDGKTDLVSLKKFGRAKYNSSGLLIQTTIQNLNNFITPHRYDQLPQLINSPTANKIIFHLTTTNTAGDQTLLNLSTTLSIDNKLISPLSLVLSATNSNQLNTYKSELYIHDPIIREDTRYTINNDNFTEGQLRTIDNGSPICQKIEYKPMVESNNTDAERLYTTTDLGLNYPFYIHKNIGVSYLVYKVHTLFDNTILTKEYRYENGIQHLQGKGFLGFQKTFCSDAYESELVSGKFQMKNLFKALFWKVNTYDPLLENALSESTYGSLNPNSVFTRTITNSQRFSKSNNRYLIMSTYERTIDYLKGGIYINKTYQYDNANDLLLQKINTDYNGIGASETKYFYAPDFINGDHNFYGKISKTETTTFKDGMSFATKSEQSYNINGTLLQSKKFSNNSPAIITDYSYHSFGEIQSETLSTIGMSNPLTTTYAYEASNRFVNSVTTPDGKFSTSIINPLGRVISDVSALGLTSSYKYDRWGSLIETTDFLGKKTFITKFFDTNDLAGTYNISKKREGGTESIIKMNKFDREIETKAQSIDNKWVVSRTLYDIYGKKIRVSEPFFVGEPIKWNTTEYDEINRPIRQTSFTGKSIDTCYEGLKVAVDENNGTKNTAKWLDAMGNTIKHADGGGEILYSYYPNGSLKETNYDGIKTKIDIDAWGNKTKLDDPSAGIYTYTFDNLSRPLTETNPRGGVTTYHYDSLGRPDIETTVGGSSENTNITKNFYYDNTTKLPTIIDGTNNGKYYKYTTFYNDPFFRVTSKKEETPIFDYETITTFDSFGRVETTQLKTSLKPGGFVTISNIRNIYDVNGILIKQQDTDTNKDVWQVNTINSHGQTMQLQYGNGYIVNNTYDADNFRLKRINHNNGTNTIVDVVYDYDITKGVLLSRNNFVFGKNETFLYDNLNRLLEEKTNGLVTQTYTFDPRGRMTTNTAIGKYNYNEQNYKLQDINFNTNGETVNSSRGFAEIQYNSFKNPTEIFLVGKDRISYDFSILKTRTTSYYGSLDATSTNRPNRKFYSADKAVEIVKEGNITKIITYITGDPYSANYIKIDVLNNGSFMSADNYYLHRDNQSSIVAISKADNAGTVIEKRFFDAWGNLTAAIIGNTAALINSLGWVSTLPSGAGGLLIDRGYTGHEFLKTVGLIHMNGRIYDPILRRFLSPDNYVQDPYNTQNFNRYGYVYNNPLLYTDPSGEIPFLAVVFIGMAVGIMANGINNMINGIPFWYGAGKAGLMGAVSGAISFGIGSIATNTFQATMSVCKSLFEAGMHGITSGIMSDIQGGTFASGFAAGAVSSLVSSGIQSLGETGGIKTAFGNSDSYKAVLIASGGLSGGIASTIAGGNFWDGMRQGLITSGLNHLAHEVSSGFGGEDENTNENDPPNKYKRFFANKLNEAQNSYNKSKIGLRQIFNGAEITGGTMEIAGSLGAIFTDGATLSIAAEGFKISTFGTAGNVIMDIIEGQYDSAFYRTAKFGVTFGMGKAIEKGVSFAGAQQFWNGYKSFMETYVAPVLEDSWNKFTPRQNKLKN